MKKEAKKTLIKLIVAVPLMFAFGFALVPLYDVFCEVTGINGKVFQSEYSEELVTDDGRTIAIQFISTNNENMPWTFKPSEQVMKIETGKYHGATFYVKNTTDKKNDCSGSSKCCSIKCSCTSKKTRMFLL